MPSMTKRRPEPSPQNEGGSFAAYKRAQEAYLDRIDDRGFTRRVGMRQEAALRRRRDDDLDDAFREAVEAELADINRISFASSAIFAGTVGN